MLSPLRSAIASLLLATTIPANHGGLTFSNAFVATARGRIAHPTAASTTRIFGAEERNDEAASDNSENSSTTTLEFVGRTINVSEPAPKADGEKSLYDFFALPQSAPLLMRGSKNNTVEEIEKIDAELLKQYRHICDKVDASPPTPGDRIFEVTTSGVKFPGLNVMSVATIGVKLTNEGLPGYEFVLIRDSIYGEGNRLFVWFFNKVTGKGKDSSRDEPSKKDAQTTFSLNRIRAVPSENDTVAFETDAYLQVLVKFPSFLMKVIPGASKEKFEKTGGASLRKVLDDDTPAALEAFRREYVRWLES